MSFERERVTAYFQSIKYPFFRNKSYLYIPYGPVTKELSTPFLKFLKTELQALGKESNAVFVRLDFTPPAQSDEHKKLLTRFFTIAPKYTYHSAYFQPRVECFLDLRQTEEELFCAMRKGARYGIRLAGRKGLTVEIITNNFENYFSSFYELMLETAKRNNFNLAAFRPVKFIEVGMVLRVLRRNLAGAKSGIRTSLISLFNHSGIASIIFENLFLN